MSKPWVIRQMTGTLMWHSLIVANPACPEGRHPTRECGCKVFRTRAEAEKYAGEQATAVNDAVLGSSQ